MEVIQVEILGAIAELIPTIGFPVICVIGLGWFIYKIYNDTTKQNAANIQMNPIIKNLLALKSNCD